MINDSELFHGRYDPEKARAYYLRTRKLKGRRPGTALVSPSRGGSKPSSSIVTPGGKPNRAKTESRQAQLRAQQEALKKRLERLEAVLSELVEAAKKRSGGDPNKGEKNEAEKDAAPETKVDKADRNKAEKDAKPLTSKQKSDKAKQAKEAYEKEHPNTLSTNVDILKEQVKDIQSKIQAALKSARERQDNAGLNSELVQPKKTNDDGPKGR